MGGIFGGGGGGGGGDSGVAAANIQASASREAIEAQERSSAEATEELRRQFEITQENIAPFLAAGTGALPQVQEGTTIGGLEQRLGRIFDTDIFGNLVEQRERSVQSQLAATGQLRSGTGLAEAARIPTDIGLSLEGLLTGRAEDLVTGGRQAALGLGTLGGQTSASIANVLQATGARTGGLISGIGQAGASGILTDAQASAQRTQNSLNLAGTIGGLFLGGALFGGSGVSSRALGFDPFSDPALKENIEEIGECHDLKIYQWDWIESTKNTIIEKCSNIGFMADEVQGKYPQFVKEFCGFLTINYNGLLDHLEAS
jgi:hypothetical protein